MVESGSRPLGAQVWDAKLWVFFLSSKLIVAMNEMICREFRD